MSDLREELAAIRHGMARMESMIRVAMGERRAKREISMRRAAAELDISPRTLRRRIDAGLIRSRITPTGRVMISRDEIERATSKK